MTTILIKDSLRQSVEAASNGLQTVLYTAKGQPTFVNVLEKFDMSTIDVNLSGIHPAFIINGVTKDKLFIGTYQGVVRNGEFLSLPNQAASTAMLDSLIANVRANGAGHHLITNAEWSAIALKTWKDNTQPLGNTYFGRSVEDATQFGRRIDGLDASAGITNGTNAGTLTGSGPVKWRHNQKYNGISDLAGNGVQYCTGLRVYGGEIQIIDNNNAALATADLSATSALWKAIHAETGELITPDGTGTTANSVKLANSGTADYTLVMTNFEAFSTLKNASTTKPVSATALNKLKMLGIFPISSSLNDDGFGFLTNQTESVCLRGGGASAGIRAGIFFLSLASGRVGLSSSRPCYYTP